jgi:hypothetical protein
MLLCWSAAARKHKHRKSRLWRSKGVASKVRILKTRFDAAVLERGSAQAQAPQISSPAQIKKGQPSGPALYLSGRRDLNSRRRPWQNLILPFPIVICRFSARHLAGLAVSRH